MWEHASKALPGLQTFHHGGEKAKYPVVFVAGVFEPLLVHHDTGPSRGDNTENWSDSKWFHYTGWSLFDNLAAASLEL